jgi:hypothetical protein
MPLDHHGPNPVLQHPGPGQGASTEGMIHSGPDAQIEVYWQLGCKVLNLPGNDVSTYLDGMKARAGRAHARSKSIGVPTP